MGRRKCMNLQRKMSQQGWILLNNPRLHLNDVTIEIILCQMSCRLLKFDAEDILAM